jgi:EAL domain-containing protein (putative c-di-GMP-specific phosphodiesterase class I)
VDVERSLGALTIYDRLRNSEYVTATSGETGSDAVNNPHHTTTTPPRAFRDPSRFHADLADDLRGAAGRGEMLAYFQPQIDLTTGLVVAAEALCRWRHPALGLIAPGVFIGIAEQTDVIHEIGSFMIAESCNFLTRTNLAGQSLEVSVNVSPSQLTSSAVFDDLATRITDGSLDPAKLTLEVTETVEIVDLDSVVSLLHNIRGLGVGISIDDFGVGHSSASQLTALPVTEVKIDRSLVQGESDTSRTQVDHAMSLARDRGLRVVGEGVENLEQKEYARAAGCHRAQGYLLGRPMSFPRFESFVGSRSLTA